MVKNIPSKRQVKFKHVANLLVLSLSIVLFSCKQYNPCEELTLKDVRVKKIVSDYISKYPQFNTFLIKQSPMQIVNDTIIESGFLVGPCYDNILEDYNGFLHVSVLGRRIYCISDINRLLKESVKDTWKNTNPPDSLVVLWDNEKRVVKDAYSLFVHRAIFFRLDERDSLIVNFRPDTLFFPKRLDPIVRFENTTN